jgi:hypothetical protein
MVQEFTMKNSPCFSGRGYGWQKDLPDQRDCLFLHGTGTGRDAAAGQGGFAGATMISSQSDNQT